MLRRTRLVGGFAFLLMAAVVLAQPPGGPGGPGGKGKGGFGGPGFGRVFGGPGMGGAAGLLRMPEVRKEIATTEQQNKQIDALLSELQEQMRPPFDFRELQEL